MVGLTLCFKGAWYLMGLVLITRDMTCHMVGLKKDTLSSLCGCLFELWRDFTLALVFQQRKLHLRFLSCSRQGGLRDAYCCQSRHWWHPLLEQVLAPCRRSCDGTPTPTWPHHTWLPDGPVGKVSRPDHSTPIYYLMDLLAKWEDWRIQAMRRAGRV